MIHKNHNDEFEQDKDFQILHKKYQSASIELPSASVDAEILRAAHQAVGSSPPVIALTPTRSTWYVPAAYAAVLVLSLSVVMKLAFEPEYDSTEMIKAKMIEADAMFLHDKSVRQIEQKNINQRQLQKPQSLMQQVAKEANPLQKSQIQKSQPKRFSKQAKPEMARKSEHSPPRSSVLAMPATIKSVDVIEEKALTSDYSVQGPAQGRVLKSKSIQDIGDDRQTRIKHLMALYDLQQFEKLKQAMQDYRKDYPENYPEVELEADLEIRPSEGERNKLPQVLRDWEQINQ